MVKGYKLPKKREDYEEIDRLFYGNHKIQVFDNPNYIQQPYPQQLESFTQQECKECLAKDKEVEFYRKLLLIIVGLVGFKVVIDSVKSSKSS